MNTKTVGVSPKAVLAFLYPLIAAAIFTAVHWVVTGEFSRSELDIALTGVAASGVAALGAYVGRPGDVRVSGR